MTDPAPDMDALIARCESLQREQAELASFALIGQAFLGLSHELNNVLNSMMLQTSVVELRADAQGRQELAAIRQHGAQAVGLLRMLQHVVQEQREEYYPVDLNSVFASILEEDKKLHRRVSLHLSQNAPHIQSTRSAVKQLLRLLLQGVSAATHTTVQAATDEQDGDAILRLTIRGTDSDAPVEKMLWQNLDEVGRLAAQSLLRQMSGALTAERSGDARILRVIWKQSSY